jgi:hypothetical protein
MFILAAKCPPPGVEVDAEFALPAFYLVPHPVRLHCIGQVSRVERCYQLSGFAVVGQIVNETFASERNIRADLLTAVSA